MLCRTEDVLSKIAERLIAILIVSLSLNNPNMLLKVTSFNHNV